MPIYKGDWLDAEGNPFMPDCYAHDDPFGGPRCSLRPHDTKRHRRPGDFGALAEFGKVARDWSEKLTAYERAQWSYLEMDVKNRFLEDARVSGHLEFMNHNMPQCHANADEHHEYKDYCGYSFLSMRLLEVDTDYDKLRMDVTYTSYYADPDNGTLHFHQVHPDDVDGAERCRYAYHIGSHDMETDKRHPDKQVDEFWLPLAYHADQGDRVQIYLRISMMYLHIPPPFSIDGVTTSFAPMYYTITA